MNEHDTTGADLIWHCLVREGVEVVFGYPGGAILPAYDALGRHPRIHHVLTRHEQGAAHMADGYARATGKVGVALATSGPGATNLVTGIATAMMDSSPIVCITGQVPSALIGTDAFQETDVTGVTLPITKHNELVTEAEGIAPAIHRAFRIAREGRPGPVLVDITKDAQLGIASLLAVQPDRPTPSDGPPLESRAVAEAQALIAAASNPIVLAGQGVLIADAAGVLRRFVERHDLPVALTLLGKGGFPESHPLCLGMMGMHGHASTNKAIQEADLLLAFGMRFDDRVTGKLETYATHARKLHVDIDPSEIGKNVAVDVGLVCDLKDALTALDDGLAPRLHTDWRQRIANWQHEDQARDVVHRSPEPGRFLAAQALHGLWQSLDPDVVTVTDVGQHQMLEAQYCPHQRPRTLITSGGLGTMGFAVPAAIGAKLARPDQEVWAIVGDGGFQMTMAELATAVQEQVEIRIAIVNNGYLGMVRQWQELFHDQRYHQTAMTAPDFCMLAAAFGIPARRITRPDDLADAVAETRSHRGGPSVLELVVEQHDLVYPMVPAGADLDRMLRRPQDTRRPVLATATT